MTRRPSSRPPQPTAPNLTPEHMRKGIEGINRRIVELEKFDPDTVEDRSDPRIAALQTAIADTLVRILGEGTPDYDRYAEAQHLDTAGIVRGTSLKEVERGLYRGRERAFGLLHGLIKKLEEDLEDDEGGAVVAAPAKAVEPKKVVFIVHGQDEEAKEKVARFLEKVGLEAIILHEKADGGDTLIEKFEKHGGRAGYAIVLLTPDDVGGLATADETHPRARQNVIFELGFFIAKLGRKNVCALKKGEVEIPTDYPVIYEVMDDGGAWQVEVATEMKAAGVAGEFDRLTDG